MTHLLTRRGPGLGKGTTVSRDKVHIMQVPVAICDPAFMQGGSNRHDLIFRASIEAEACIL